MKNVRYPLLLMALSIFTSFTDSNNFRISDECDVDEFYQALDTQSGIKVLTSGGELEEAELILVPTKMKEGRYKVELTRKASNLYKVEGTKFYIETRYCYEYATYDDAILKVESNYGYTKGKIYFE